MGSAVFGVHLNEEDDEIRGKYATVVRAGCGARDALRTKESFLPRRTPNKLSGKFGVFSLPSLLFRVPVETNTAHDDYCFGLPGD